MFDQLTDLLGPVGYLLGLILGGGVWLYRAERTERVGLQEKMDALQERRVEESRETTKELFASTQTLEKAITLLQART